MVETFDNTKSLEVKKQILAFIGSNLTLKDKKLNIVLEKPLTLIKEASTEVQNIKERLEPLNNAYISMDFKDLYSQNPKLLQTVYRFRTFDWKKVQLKGLFVLDILMLL